MEGNILYGFLVILLLWVAWEDFRTRTIPVLLFLLLLPVCVTIPVVAGHADEFVYSAVHNFIFLGLVYLFLVCYFSLRAGYVLNIADRYIGKGDLILVPLVSFLFAPLNFIGFFCLVSVVTLVAALCFGGRKTYYQEIPIGGAWSVGTVLIIILHLLQVTDLFRGTALLNLLIS